MPRKKSPGRKLPQGKTKKEILKIILQHPQGVEESEIREILKQNFNIIDSRGVKRHLSDLMEKGLIFKQERCGQSNIWKFNLKSAVKVLNEPELHSPLLDWLITVSNLIPKEYEKVDISFSWFIQVVEAFKENRKIAELLKSRLFQAIAYFVIDRLVPIASIHMFFKDEIKNENVYDLPEEYKTKLRFLASESPSCFVTVLEFAQQMNLLEWRDVKKLIRFLEIESIPTSVISGSEIADVVRKELGILLYSAIKKDIASGVLNKDFVDKWNEFKSRKTQTPRINGRKSFFKKLKETLLS